jgi:hypothetical protein
MVIFLSILLVVVLVRPFGPPGDNPTPYETPEQAVVPPKVDVEIDWPPLKEYPADLRNPMVLGSTQQGETGTGGIVVRGIVYSETGEQALIDGQQFGEGDTVMGATIVEITPNSVEFEKDGERWVQEVQGEED